MNENAPSISFHRTREGKILAGVCSGLSRRLGIDVHVLRLAIAVAACFTIGTVVAVYVAAWLLLPEEGKDTSIAQDLLSKHTGKSTGTGLPIDLRKDQG